MKDKVYTYKGNHYVVVEDNAQMKIPATEKWEPAVIYRNHSGEIFCRLRESFYQKFILLTNEQ